jgi:hypothetical protein
MQSSPSALKSTVLSPSAHERHHGGRVSGRYLELNWDRPRCNSNCRGHKPWSAPGFLYVPSFLQFSVQAVESSAGLVFLSLRFQEGKGSERLGIDTISANGVVGWHL